MFTSLLLSNHKDKFFNSLPKLFKPFPTLFPKSVQKVFTLIPNPLKLTVFNSVFNSNNPPLNPICISVNPVVKIIFQIKYFKKIKKIFNKDYSIY